MSCNPIPLSVDGLLAAARKAACVEVIDHAVVEPLTVMHRALCEQANLSAHGALGQQNKLLRILVNRLRMLRDFARHPEIAEQRIEKPLIIMGMPRSGTTKTQKVLAATGDFNWMPFWQTWNWASSSGVPNEDTTARIEDAERFCRWFDEVSPETRLGHSFETHEPEEDNSLNEGCMVTPSFIGYAEIPDYVQWAVQQPPGLVFEFMRDVLKYLQWQGLASAGKRWLLKSPMYNGLELEILKVFPDARLVMVHRSPVSTLSSGCKLLQCFRRAYSDATPNYAVMMEGFIMGMQGHLANRATYPDLPLLDVGFHQVTKSWPATAERIYAHAGITLTAAARERMQRWETDNAMHKHGQFRYTAEEFDLDEAKVRERMRDYFALLEQRFGLIP